MLECPQLMRGMWPWRLGSINRLHAGGDERVVSASPSKNASEKALRWNVFRGNTMHTVFAPALEDLNTRGQGALQPIGGSFATRRHGPDLLTPFRLWDRRIVGDRTRKLQPNLRKFLGPLPPLDRIEPGAWLLSWLDDFKIFRWGQALALFRG